MLSLQPAPQIYREDWNTRYPAIPRRATCQRVKQRHEHTRAEPNLSRPLTGAQEGTPEFTAEHDGAVTSVITVAGRDYSHARQGVGDVISVAYVQPAGASSKKSKKARPATRKCLAQQ